MLIQKAGHTTALFSIHTHENLCIIPTQSLHAELGQKNRICVAQRSQTIRVVILLPPRTEFSQECVHAEECLHTECLHALVAATWSMGNHQLSSFSNCWEMINVHTG